MTRETIFLQEIKELPLFIRITSKFLILLGITGHFLSRCESIENINFSIIRIACRNCVLRCTITRVKEAEVYFCAFDFFHYDATQNAIMGRLTHFPKRKMLFYNYYIFLFFFEGKLFLNFFPFFIIKYYLHFGS